MVDVVLGFIVLGLVPLLCVCMDEDRVRISSGGMRTRAK